MKATRAHLPMRKLLRFSRLPLKIAGYITLIMLLVMVGFSFLIGSIPLYQVLLFPMLSGVATYGIT